MSSPIRTAGLVLRYLSPLVVIVVGVLFAKSIIASKKAPPKTDPPARVLPVDAVTVYIQKREASLEVFGTVEPLRTLVVRPAVAGPVTAAHADLIKGGRIGAGQTLVQIDRRDYALGVRTAEAAVLAAQADLDVEKGNATVAAKEWELLGSTFESDETSKRLALREPFVKRREADVASARVRLDQALLDLERTAIVAPFNAIVLSENVEVGSYVSMGAELATLVDSGTFAVEVSVPLDRLGSLEKGESEAMVQVGGSGAARPAKVIRVLGEVDREGRMARVQIAIENPLKSTESAGPVLLGAYAKVVLPLEPVDAAASIPRGALREGDVVWIVNGNNELTMCSVSVAMRRDGDVFITAGLEAGDRVITSPIAVPLPGMKLRITSLDASPFPPVAAATSSAAPSAPSMEADQ